MANVRGCGCKGIRSCLICEQQTPAELENTTETDSRLVYCYCTECCMAYNEPSSQHPAHHGNCLKFDGITIIPDFVSEDEEQFLISNIYKAPFVLSQSGRRKQDFGPKVNFKKRKLRTDKFSGLPSYFKFLYDRMQANVLQLSNFLPVELCNLEYSSDRGSAIDPHFDDFWLWGERLVTLNLLSDSALSFTRDATPDVEVCVPLLRRSLIVVSSDARNIWRHGIQRCHVHGTRIATTLRELTPEFLEGGKREAEGKQILEIALTFEGMSVAEA